MLIGHGTPEARPIREITDRTKFRRIMRDRPGHRVRVIVQVAPEAVPPATEPPWWDFEVFWEGPWSDDLPIPTPAELRMYGNLAGAAFARSVVRAVI